MPKKILVTGASGFVGRALLEGLLSQGYNALGTVRSFTQEPPAKNYHVVGDIDGDTNWQDALKDVQCVVHLAGRVHVLNDIEPDPLAAFRMVNVEGTLNLARQASAQGVLRFVFLSTVKVNGELTSHHPFQESDEVNPADPYGQSKMEAESGLFEIAEKTGMDVVIIRPPLIYGPGVKANFYTLIRLVAARFPLPLGLIHNKRSFLALENLLSFILVCIEHEAAANQVFFVSDGEDCSTTELLEKLGKALNVQTLLLPIPNKLLRLCLYVLGKRNLSLRLCGSLQVDITKARGVLGWTPPQSMDEGLLKVTNWYREQSKP